MSQERPIQLTRKGLEVYRNSLLLAAGGAPSKDALAAAARALEWFAAAVEKLEVGAGSEAEQLAAEETIRQVAVIARESAEVFHKTAGARRE
jgi:hypothetical protein